MIETYDSAIVTKPDSTTAVEGETELLNKLWKWQLESEGNVAERNFRTEAKEDYDFYAGKQDTTEVLSELEEQQRPSTVFNTILPKINLLIGLAGQSNRVPYLFPVSMGDDAITEIMNGAFKHFRRKAKLARLENECFEHAVKSGRSLLGFWIGGDNPMEPEIKAVRISGRDFLLDPTSVAYDMSDARYLFVDKWLEADDIKAFFPNISLDEIKSLSRSSSEMPQFYNTVTDKYRLTECWYRKYETIYWVENPLTGKVELTTPAELTKFKTALRQGIPDGKGGVIRYDKEIKSVKRMVKKVYYAIYSGNKLVEAGPSPYKHNHFPYVLFGAYKDEDENRWFSVVNMMKDPQRGRNAMRRQLQHLLQTAPKGLLVHEVGALIDPEEYDAKSSQPNFRLVIAQGKFDKWKFTDQPQISPVYAQLDQTYEQDMKDSSGIQNDLMGIETSSRQSGVTLRLRQQTGMAVLYILFDNFRESRLHSAEIMVSMIQQYMTQAQMIRIEGPEGAYLTQINTQMNPQVQGYNDISALKYDFAIDEAVENTTMRMAIAQMLTEFSQNNPGSIPPDMILEYSDMPLSARMKVKAYHEQMMQREERMMEMEIEAKRESSLTKAQTAVFKGRQDKKNRAAKQNNKK
jgi:hypothetical protein